jgi:hypothetical protein
VSGQHSPTVATAADPINSHKRGFVEQVLLASVAEDPAALRAHLDAAVAALGLGRCIDDVLLPTMREIGTRWQHGLFGIDSERLTTEAVRGWLEVVALDAPQPSPNATLLLACGPSDRHSIALEALGLLLRYQQQPCRMLGPRTSTRALAVAVAANKPIGIVLVSHLETGRLGATQALRSVTGLGAELFYAGGAFATARLRRHVPGTYLGTNIQAACTMILAATKPNI